MKKFESFNSIVTPLDIINVDTDAIIPKQFLKSIKRTGFGNNLFDDWRYLDKDIEGSGRKDRKINQDFILNKKIYVDSKILLARENFGCGSSREHAPWALLDYGFQVIISSSFADIFTSNSFKNGLLLITLDKKIIETLFDKTKKENNLYLSVNITDQKVFNDDITIDFEIDEFKKKCLIEGLDEIGLTLQKSNIIEEFEKILQKVPMADIKKNILLLPGDGIGPEIIDQAKKVLDEIKSNNLFDFSLETGYIGGAAYDKYKNPFPPDTIENAKKADGILLGAVGGPEYDNLPRNFGRRLDF